MTILRSDLPPLPPRMQRLKLDHRGFPVPWFVQWIKDDKAMPYGEGEPDFRVMDRTKLIHAIKFKSCWVCGETIGKWMTFTIGPMCAVNRVNAEPPSHFQCAEFSALACPFLSRPRMRRNEKDLPTHEPMAGFGIERNPGVTCLWVTNSYQTFRPNMGGDGVMFQLGEPSNVLWFCEGRKATREEVLHSIDTGYPILMKMAQEDGPEGVAALHAQRLLVEPLLPGV